MDILPQKYNADYDLSARQGADTLAFMSLLEEKLLPVLVSVPRTPSVHGQWGRGPGTHTRPLTPTPTRSLGAAWGSEAHPESGMYSKFRPAYSFLHPQSQVHTFWIDAKNYVEVTRKWYAEAMPFPLNFFLPGRMQRQHMERLQLLCGEHRPENEEELEKEVPLG